MSAPAIADLSSLLHPLTWATFAATMATRRALHHPGLPERLRTLEAALGSLEIEALAHSQLSQIRIYEGEGEHFYTRQAAPDEALCAYRRGASLQFIAPQNLRGFVEGIAAELGMAPGTIQYGVYATPAGGGVPCHFDIGENFTIQLRGTKTWRVATNTHLESPVEQFLAGTPLTAELASYAALPLPDDPLATGETFTLSPGSMLYVPRGHWHATATTEGSLAVSIGFRVETWVDVVGAALRALLVEDPQARTYASPTWGGDPAALQPIIARLVHGLSAWAQPAAPPTPATTLAVNDYRRRALARLELGPAVARVRSVTATEEHTIELEVDDELAPLLAWVASQASGFSLAAAHAAHPALDPDSVRDALEALCVADYLEAA